MAHRVPITIRLDSFEGPLDLLLYLIQSHEFDISRISIGKITDQYLAYVRLMQDLNFDIASDFLVMAATLLQWKSKALLPQEAKANGQGQEQEDGELTQEELVRQLMEHQRFLAAGEELSQLPLLGQDVFTRPNDKPPIERIWRNQLDLTALSLSYQDMIARSRRRKKILKKETVSLNDKLLDFSMKVPVGKLTEMSAVLSPDATRPEVVVTFLASLELSRLKKMRLYQDGVYQPIYMELIESLEGFDFHLATGFEAEKPAEAGAVV